jgi:hypothetical protein
LDAKIHPRRKLRMQSSRTAGDSSSTQPRIPNRGNPRKQKRTAEGQRFGATRRSANRQRRETQDLGQPGNWPIDVAGGLKSRGNPEVQPNWCSQRIRSFGETWRFADGTIGWCANRGDSGAISRGRRVRNLGQPEKRITAIPKDRDAGQPEHRPVGTAEGREIRGDSKIRRRQSRRCSATGQP